MLKVRTETSTYVIDPEAMTVVRHPGDWDVEPGAMRRDLRRDGETMRLVEFDEPIVGERLWMKIDLREDGILTVRQTTYVTEVEQL